ncbi:maltose alpha-D-glucosyltransferase [Schaalia sp. Marseille-Q2122]|uniref:maltose alpha-D-glucosyltransferase n=1 Tax=Schaalia sp. Marseille-Q2122 TaxID=2736604 RepID=UPI00158F59C3|nr:maltose alpha-D-glucosyltransferase [Schaalia sp. Marseille-Q2122]
MIPGIPALPYSAHSSERTGCTPDTEWFRTAVFYEVLLRAYADSNGDGFGDFPGLSSRLDYLAWLGVDAIWIPPFYPSPLRDGGYDIADYTAVDPRYGTLDDFDALVEAAHARGIRVVIDLVLNHTSDAHPWFQASRTDPDGPYGNFYVWADDDRGYDQTRIIFVDTEDSNWSFDEVRGQYYWHRFFSHQPDLNYDEPAVFEAVADLIRFWAERGVDGFRLDAIPYLIEREGTNCENLPGTHDIIARIRALLDAEYPGVITIAEANQMPEEVVEFFGTEERPECTMCFHFPIMPRIYLSLREGSPRSIRQVLAETPSIPAHGQWGTFLRNHDELTLEMVSDEERALMYGWYAPEPRMRANVGIRRRLASLLGDSRAEIELAHALLLSLPGSPCLYYGDEVLMGENIWLADRDAVRTPMQWDSSANMGFSAVSDASRLSLPLIEAEGYAQRNVADALADPASFLHTLRGMLAVRRQHPVLGTGDFELIDAGDERILAYLRRGKDSGTDADAAAGRPAGEVLVCVANLADEAVAGRLSVGEWDASAVRPLLSVGEGARAVSSSLGEDGALEIALPARGFQWFAVERALA